MRFSDVELVALAGHRNHGEAPNVGVCPNEVAEFIIADRIHFGLGDVLVVSVFDVLVSNGSKGVRVAENIVHVLFLAAGVLQV